MSQKAFTPTPEQLILLRRNLTDYFGRGELRALCSELGVEYERLRGQSQAARAGDLVRTFAARGRIGVLVALAARQRPDVPWGDLPTDLAAQSDAPRPAAAPGGARGRGAILARLGWLAAWLAAVGVLVALLNSGLRLGRPGLPPTLDTLYPAPTGAPPAVGTPLKGVPRASATPTAVAVTATPQWTPLPPTETVLPMPTALGTTALSTMELVPSATALSTTELAPSATALAPRATARVEIRAPRTVTPLTPINGVCEKPLAVTFKWTGATLGPGEAFLVVIAPSEIYRAKCTSGSREGVRISSPVTGYEWTADLSFASPQMPAACAGLVEWTVYISHPAGNIQAAPWQFFEWNPLRCK